MPANRFGCGMLPDPLQWETKPALLSSILTEDEMSFREMDCGEGSLRWKKAKKISKIQPL